MSAQTRGVPTVELVEILAVIDRFRGDREAMRELCQELHDVHNWTWDRIGDRLGVDGSTVWRLVHRDTNNLGIGNRRARTADRVQPGDPTPHRI
jgi:hypothetical protein